MILTMALKSAGLNYRDRIGFQDHDAAYTYGELAERTASLARGLRELGVAHGDRVAVLMPNHVSHMEVVFAAASIGAITVPVNTRLNLDELTHVLTDSAARILITGPAHADLVDSLRARAPELHEVVFVSEVPAPLAVGSHIRYQDLVASPGGELEVAEGVRDTDVVILSYTSGTTGRSKGVRLTHAGITAVSINNYALLVRPTADDNWAHAAPMFHGGGIMQLLANTFVGARNIALPGFDPESFLRLCETERVTGTFLVPTMLNMVLSHAHFADYDTTSLRKIFYSASAMPKEVLLKAFELLPGVSFYQGYGSTECGMVIGLSAKHHRPNGSDTEQKRLTSCGQPFSGTMVDVIDAEGRRLPPGQVGELIISGPTLSDGYWNLPDETARAYRGQWYHSGDLGYRDEDNFYYIVDRAKDMIITGGENVFSNEVEQVLYQHPAVQECAVIAVPDPVWGEAVKAIVALRADASADAEEIVSFARNRLAPYKVPKSVDLVEELPKNSTGKIQKHMLRQQYWAGASRLVN